MKLALCSKVLICLVGFCVALYAVIERQNEVMEMQRTIPQLEKEVKAIHEENAKLQYEIDQFESPLHLMELARKPEFTHLKQARTDEVTLIPGSR